MSTTPPKTEQELKDYCLKPRPNETPVSEESPLGQIRCVARFAHSTCEYWGGKHWHQNSCYAKRYSPAAAKMVATKKEAIVTRYHEAGGSTILRYA